MAAIGRAIDADGGDADRGAAAGQGEASLLRPLVLLRLAAGEGSRTELVRDLKVFATVAGQSASAIKATVEAEVERLVAGGMARKAGSRVAVTDAGREHASRLVRTSGHADVLFSGSWGGLRDGPLTLAAIGADPGDAKLVKAVQSPDGLRALVVQAAYGFGLDKVMSLGKLRTALALRALERAFGGQIKTALGNGAALAPKPSRLLAAQLARVPKDYGSDSKLIAVLAAEHVSGADGSVAPNFRGAIVPGDVDGLRTRLIARWAVQVVFPTTMSGGEARLGAMPVARRVSPPSGVGVPGDAARPTVPPANDRGTEAEVISRQSRPDLPGFVRAIAAAAAARAQGWPGNRKAFICHVFDEVSAVHPQWRLSEIEFKGMLAEAHRTGGVVLANADLKDKRFIQEFEKSAIQYKNTIWHFVRVEEP